MRIIKILQHPTEYSTAFAEIDQNTIAKAVSKIIQIIFWFLIKNIVRAALEHFPVDGIFLLYRRVRQ